MKETAPTVLALLNGSFQVHIPPSRENRRKIGKIRQLNKGAITGLCTAIQCLYRKQSMNLVNGGVNKQVRTNVISVHERTIGTHNLWIPIMTTDMQETAQGVDFLMS